jgi:hypothetical protein
LSGVLKIEQGRWIFAAGKRALNRIGVIVLEMEDPTAGDWSGWLDQREL